MVLNSHLHQHSNRRDIPRHSIGRADGWNEAGVPARRGLTLAKARPLDGRSHFFCATLQAVDKPATGGARRSGSWIDGRHRYDDPAWWSIFNRKPYQSALTNVAFDGVHRHAAPAKPIEKKSVLGEEVRKPPDRGRHHRELDTCRQSGSVSKNELHVLRQFRFRDYSIL